MKIYWYGKTCFEIITNEKTQDPVSIVIDPINTNFPKKDTNILVLTHPVEYNKKEKVFTISAAGEYEVKDVYVRGIPLKEGGLIFILKAEGMKICHLGGASVNELTEEQISSIGSVDVLFISGGEEDKTKMIKQIEPAIVIPMDYNDVELFLKRVGATGKEGVDYYKPQKKNFDEPEEVEVIVLNKK